MNKDRCICIGSLNMKWKYESAERVYSAMALSPTLRTRGDGGYEVKIAIYEESE
jgi:hypothetical protein